jgi:hypothetical protein
MKATRVPSFDTVVVDAPARGLPLLFRLARRVSPVSKSWTYERIAGSSPSSVRFVARELKAANRPSLVMYAPELWSFPSSPVDETLTAETVRSRRS